MAPPTESEQGWLSAAQALAQRVSAMSPGEFWREVSALGWSARVQVPIAAAELLAARFGPEQLVAMKLRFEQLDTQLSRAIDLWSLQHEESLGLPMELQRELRAHIIGLGEIPYGAAVAGPWRARHRADRDDYLEGFWRVFDLALERTPAEQLQQLAGAERRAR